MSKKTKSSKSPKVSAKTAYTVVHSTVKYAEEAAVAVFGKEWSKSCKVGPAEGGGFQLYPLRGKGSRKAALTDKQIMDLDLNPGNIVDLDSKPANRAKRATTSLTEDAAVKAGNVIIAEGGSPVAKLSKSTVKHPVEAMWELCDQMKGARRKDVIIAAMEAGIAYYTARTQYQLWKKAGAASPAK